MSRTRRAPARRPGWTMASRWSSLLFAALASASVNREMETVSDEAVGGPLHQAALKASMEWAEQAIASGADLSEQDAIGYTPLHRVAEDGLNEVVELFLAHGASTEARDNNEATPLLLAAGSGHVEVMETLLDHGARVDALDEYGLGSLHYAAESGQLGAIRVLMKHGARVDVVDEAGKTPAELARAWGFAEAAVLLDQHQEAASIPRQEGGDGTAATQDSAPSVNKPDEARSGGPRRMQMPSNLQPEKLEL